MAIESDSDRRVKSYEQQPLLLGLAEPCWSTLTLVPPDDTGAPPPAC